MLFNKEIYRSDAYKALRDVTNDIFVKYLHEKGFVLFHKRQGPALYHCYHRKSAYGYDCVSIQFDKYARPKFIINVAKIPANGITLAERHVDAKDATEADIAIGMGLRGHVYKQLRNCVGLKWPQWYGIAYRSSVDFSKTARDEVRTLLQDFQEAELWFGSVETSKRRHLDVI